MISEVVHNLVGDLVLDLIYTHDRDVIFTNLELENDHDYLLENGGFILLE